MPEAKEARERKDVLAGVFGRAAATYDRAGPSFFLHFGARLVDVAAVAAGEDVLDIACGAGAVSAPAAGRGARVVAIDLAPEMVERTRALGVDARLMDAEELDFDDGSFDCALSGFGLFFLPDPARGLAGIHRVLRPGGRLAFTTFTEEDDERWAFTKELPGARPDRSENPFHRREGIAALLADAGFEPPSFSEEGHELVFADADEWWAWSWSHGARGWLERLSPEDLERHRREAFEHVEAMPEIRHSFFARITRARRP